MEIKLIAPPPREIEMEVSEYMEIREKFKQCNLLITELYLIMNKNRKLGRQTERIIKLQDKLNNVKYGVENVMWKEHPEIHQRTGDDPESQVRDYEFRVQFFF